MSVCPASGLAPEQLWSLWDTLTTYVNGQGCIHPRVALYEGNINLALRKAHQALHSKAWSDAAMQLQTALDFIQPRQEAKS